MPSIRTERIFAKRKHFKNQYAKRKKPRLSPEINLLPEEMLVKIFSFCDLKDYPSIGLACKFWHSLCYEPSLVAKKCQDLISTLVEPLNEVDDKTLQLMRNNQQYVQSLDLSELEFQQAVLRVADTVNPYFRKLEILKLPLFNHRKFGEFKTNLRIHAKYLENFQPIQYLEWLFIESKETCSKPFEKINTLYHVQTLSVYGTHLTPMNMNSISHVSGLQTLLLSNQKFNVDHIRPLTKMPLLKEIAFYECDFSRNAGKELEKLRNLTLLKFESLEARIMNLLTSKHALKRFTKLEHFMVSKLGFPTPEAIEAFLEMPQLNYVGMKRTRPLEKAVKQIQTQYLKKYSRVFSVYYF